MCHHVSLYDTTFIENVKIQNPYKSLELKITTEDENRLVLKSQFSKYSTFAVCFYENIWYKHSIK